MPINLAPLLDAVKSKLLSIRANHPRYTLSTKAISGQLSIEYTTIPMSKPCKYVMLYYSGDCVYAFKKLIWLFQRCADNQMLQMDNVCSTLETYVNGWASGKEITSRNIKALQNMVSARHDVIKRTIHEYDDLRKTFDSLNTHDDTEMVDHFELSLYQTVSEFPYRRAYKHFFKKDKVNDKLIETHLQTDREILDRLIQLMTVLYMGWNKVGKGDAYEKYRLRQRDLILIVDQFADVVSLDIDLYERFATLNETVIAFKVYPYEKTDDD